jgi:hypothetical protein
VKSDISPDAKAISEARLAANRENAKHSCGPKNTERTRFNALKHGLTARMAWGGQDPARGDRFFQYAWHRLGPRNSFEETCAANLLRTREQEDSFLDAERTVLTRQPISHTSADGLPFTFLHDPDGLNALNQLARQLAHLTRASEKEFSALLAARKESASCSTSVEALGASQLQAPIAGMPEAGSAPCVNRGSLEDCLVDHRLVLPGEDVEAYRSLARGLWSVFRPANLLEGFVVVDIVQVQWCLDRVLNIQGVLLERSAISASGHNCGFGFGFLQDTQRGQTLETLRHYEAVLRKRLDKRLALRRKLRQVGWTDASLGDPQLPTEAARCSPPEPLASAPAVVSTSPGSASEPGQAVPASTAVLQDVPAIDGVNPVEHRP